MKTANPTKPSKEQQDSFCLHCGGEEFVEDRTRGEMTCTSCGFVRTHGMIDQGPEWRAFTAEERDKRIRTGSPMALTQADKGLATMIGWDSRDAGGRSFKGDQRASIYRMRKWQIRSTYHESKIRNLKIAMSELDRLASQLGIPKNIRETAAFIYRKAYARNLVRGRSIDGIVAASIYLSCRIHKIPRQLDEIAVEAKVSRRDLGAAVRRVLRYVKMHVPLPSAIDYLPRIVSDLKLKGDTVRTTISIIKRAQKQGITSGKAPGGIAGAAIYIASILEGDQRTQSEIAKTASVTEVTIRNRYKQIVESLEISFDLS